VDQVGRRNIILIIFLSIWILALASAEQPSQGDGMTIWQARGTIVAGTKHLARRNIERGSLRFSTDSFEFDASCKHRTEHYKVDLILLR
jgi:hypothetical protein